MQKHKWRENEKIICNYLCDPYRIAFFFCCADETLLSKDDPVVLNLWHVYGEQADAPMNRLVKEFNDTVGLEKGIIINVTNVTSTFKIGSQLLDSTPC